MCFERMIGIDEVVGIREMLFLEIENHVAPLLWERGVHGEFAIIVFAALQRDGQGAKSIP